MWKFWRETNDRRQCWLLEGLMHSGGWRIKQKDTCHFPELVTLHSLLFMWMTGKGITVIFLCLFFLRGLKRNPQPLRAAMVLYVREKRCLIKELDFGPHHPLVLHHTTARCGYIRSTRHSAGTTGHGPFHCITPFLTSLVHMAALFVVIETFGPTLLLFYPFAATHIRFY